MVLDYLDDGAQRLVLVLCLPLVDGVFATLLVTGAVETFSDFVAISLTIFSGAGSVAVLYSHSETRNEARRMVMQAAPILIAGSLAVAMVAPVFDQVFHVSRLRYAAGLALLVIAANLVDLEISDKFTVPAILLTGFMLSVRNPSALGITYSYVVPALATSSLAVAGLLVAASVPQERLSIRYLQGGGSLVLLTIAASLFGVEMPSGVSLTVLAAAIIASVRR
ncbi:MAG: DUF5794 domain-containing protein [Candidatus Nanohaloarchaea archaeon]